MAADTIPSRFFAQGEAHPDTPAAHTRKDGAWTSLSWREYTGLTRRVARSLIALGVLPGQATCILGFNRPEWVIFAIGTQAVGAAPAGIYTTCSPTEVQYIVDHAEAGVVLVEDAAQLEKIAQERDRLPHLRHIVLMRGRASTTRSRCRGTSSWPAARPPPTPPSTPACRDPRRRDRHLYLHLRHDRPAQGRDARHRNLLWTAPTPSGPDATSRPADTIAVVPAAVAHRRADVHDPHAGRARASGLLRRGAREGARQPQGGAADGVLRRAADLGEVPRGRRRQARARSPAAKKHLLAWAMGVARACTRTATAAPPCRPARPAIQLAQRLVFRKLKAALGLGTSRCCISGAAPIAARSSSSSRPRPAVHEVYGQSEDTGPTSFNFPGATQLRLRRPPAPRRRGQDRRRRRDPRARPQRVPRLLQGARGDRRDAHRRLAALGRPRRVRRRRLPVRSPAARRRSSSPPAARTSRRRTSRPRSSSTRSSARRWSSAIAASSSAPC